MFSEPVEKTEGRPEKPRIPRNERRFSFDIPPEIQDRLQPIDLEIIDLVCQIGVIEYPSETPGHLQIISSGMHGEETRNNLAIDELDDALRNKKVLSGKIILIPHLNVPGFVNKTRYIFSDEPGENLNTCSDGYKTGDWEEFLNLPTKTAKYAWLVVKFLTTEAQKHREQYGDEYETRLIDLHRDDAIAIPYLRIDRMWENQDLLERLFNLYKYLPIPALLEYIEWGNPDEQYAYFQALSAVAVTQGIMACVIEEGRTRGDDPLGPAFLHQALLYFLTKTKFIDIPEEKLKEEQNFYDSYFPTYKKTLDFYRHIYQTGKMYQFDHVSPSFRQGRSLTALDLKDVTKLAIENSDWDGVLSVQYSRDIRGRRERPKVPVVKIFFGEFGWSDAAGLHGYKEDVAGHLPNIGDDFCIISTPESFYSRTDVLYAVFRKTEDGLRLVLVNDEFKDEYGQTGHLTRDEIMLALSDENCKFNTTALDLFVALPDPAWKGIVSHDGEMRLLPKGEPPKNPEVEHTKLKKNIHLLRFKNRFEIASTLLRFQEYYESPEFAGKVFSLEEFKKWYIQNSPDGKATGEFTYYADWGGFNFPSSVMQAFYNGEFQDLSEAEKQILALFENETEPFYVIGVCGAAEKSDERIKHEIAHALFYTNPEYRAAVLGLLAQFDIEALKQEIKNTGGYADHVLLDEVHAYVLDESGDLKTPIPAELTQALKELYEKYGLHPYHYSPERRDLITSVN